MDKVNKWCETKLVHISMETGLSKSELMYEFFNQFIERQERMSGEKPHFRKHFAITGTGEIK